jgi:hypothetical protein
MVKMLSIADIVAEKVDTLMLPYIDGEIDINSSFIVTPLSFRPAYSWMVYGNLKHNYDNSQYYNKWDVN